MLSKKIAKFRSDCPVLRVGLGERGWYSQVENRLSSSCCFLPFPQLHLGIVVQWVKLLLASALV